MNVELKQIAESKVRQLGGTVHGVLVKNEAGAWVAVSDAGRVMWLDGFEGQAGRAQDGGSGGEIAALQKVTYEDGVADLVHMDGRQLVDFRDGTLFYTYPSASVPEGWRELVNCMQSLARQNGLSNSDTVSVGLWKQDPDKPQFHAQFEFSVKDFVTTTPQPGGDGWQRCESCKGEGYYHGGLTPCSYCAGAGKRPATPQEQ